MGSRSQGIKYTETEIPEYIEIAKAKRHTLTERCRARRRHYGEIFRRKDVTNEELMGGIRRATIAYKIVPIYCGTSLRNKGVQPMLDGVVDFLPSPETLNKLPELIHSRTKRKRVTYHQTKNYALAFKLHRFSRR